MANILITDDDALTRTFLALALQQDGHIIFQAKSGEACLPLVKQEKLDMVLLDAQMPSMDGFTCCTQLRSALGELCPPIIMITGLSDKESIDRAFSAGAIDYTTKPVNITVLKHRIRQVIRERDLRLHLEATNQKLLTANRELELLTRVDSLTRIANRRYFEEVLAREWERLGKQEKYLSLLICDIDHFKLYNDYYGHLEGDRCLQEMSYILQNSVNRSSDLVARYGGEEFIVLLPDTEADGASTLAQRIHRNLERANIPHLGSESSKRLTISIGGSFLVPVPTVSPHSLIKVADHALYRAKAEGRGCSIFEEYCVPQTLT